MAVLGADEHRGAIHEVSPDAPITVLSGGFEGEVEAVSLYRQERDAKGGIVAEESVPVQAVPADEDAVFSLRRQLLVRGADGTSPLAYDGHYRLRLTVKQRTLWPPLTAGVVETLDHTFSTKTSPRPLVGDDIVELWYRKPLAIRWNSPVERFAVDVVPPVAVETRRDPARGDVT